MRLCILFFAAALSAMAQTDSEIVYWSAGTLQGYTSSLKTLETERKSTSASQYLANLGNYKFEILRRDASGAGELHQNWTDVFVVQEGEATILYGGEIENAAETTSGEIRGPRMLAGKSQKVSAGDVIVVPPGVAHQTIVEPGKYFLTLIVKIEKAMTLKPIVPLLCVMAACTAPPPLPRAQDQLLGLWRVVEVKNLDTGTVQPERNEYHMYTESHEMIVLAGKDRPKINKSIADMTVDEVMSQQPIGAGFYSYRVEGGKLLRTNIVALSAHYEGETFETEYEINGDTLVTRDRHAADGALRQWTMERVE